MNGTFPFLFPGIFTSLERTLFFSIAALFSLVALLLCYAVLLRISFNRQDARRVRCYRAWEPMILKYLEGEAVDFRLLRLHKRDWLIFGDFINGYLENLKGIEHERLLELLRAVRFERFLVKEVRSRNRWKRIYAIRFLGEMRYLPAGPLLLDMIGDPSPLIAISAFDALEQLGGSRDWDRIIREILGRNDVSFPKISEIISRFGGEIHPILIGLLESESLPDTGKRLIVDILADKRVIEAVPAMLKLLERSRGEELIIGCIKAVGFLEAPDALPLISGFLSDPRWVVRSQAVRALGRVGTEREIPVLTEILRKDENFWVRMYCVQSLLSFGERGREALGILRREMTARPDLEDIIEFALA